ncbi:ion channel [Sediminihabitans luteus]|uniref:Ion channel n=1 Tax=Sediminihabitans luteus TaxID=1138585 RepID=A0A2M9D0Z8_9CELL|nr:potassium channel family protein [Sediminihabitans luteus]PJJ77849.1 ion channel [Sediminihabitans luteus]GII99793.1 hypothetical protein Slu03_21710 [Sediminihabitans luteus]
MQADDPTPREPEGPTPGDFPDASEARPPFFARGRQPVTTSSTLFDESGRWVDRFGVLLVLTGITITMLSLADLGAVGGVWATLTGLATTASVTLTLALALRAAGLRARWRRPAYAVLVLVAATALVLVLLVDTTDEVTTAPPVLFALAVLAPAVVARRVIHHRSVTLATVLGAVGAYLLIPVAYFYAFLTVENLGGTPFFGEDQPTSSFMYFSLTTITTLGYGDLTPAEPLGRLLAMSEAVIGQVYLVVFVALIVSLAAARVQRR